MPQWVWMVLAIPTIGSIMFAPVVVAWVSLRDWRWLPTTAQATSAARAAVGSGDRRQALATAGSGNRKSERPRGTMSRAKHQPIEGKLTCRTCGQAKPAGRFSVAGAKPPTVPFGNMTATVSGANRPRATRPKIRIAPRSLIEYRARNRATRLGVPTSHVLDVLGWRALRPMLRGMMEYRCRVPAVRALVRGHARAISRSTISSRCAPRSNRLTLRASCQRIYGSPARPATGQGQTAVRGVSRPAGRGYGRSRSRPARARRAPIAGQLVLDVS